MAPEFENNLGLEIGHVLSMSGSGLTHLDAAFQERAGGFARHREATRGVQSFRDLDVASELSFDAFQIASAKFWNRQQEPLK